MRPLDTAPSRAPVLTPRVDAHAARAPDGPALVTLAGTWSWSALRRAARRVTDALLGLDVEPGDFVAVATGTRPDFAAALCGVELAQAIPLVIQTGTGDWRAPLATVAAAAIVDAPLADGPPVVVERLGHPPRQDGSRAMSHVIFTSGTSGAPKGIVWSKQRFERDLAARQRSYGERPCLGLWSPLEHSMGFRRLATSLYAGVPLGFITDAYSIPRAFADMERLGVTHVYCTPTHVELMLRAGLPPPPRLRTLDTSAGRVAPESLVALAELLAGVQVSCSYGTTEVGTITILTAPEVRARAHTVGVTVAQSSVPINHGSVVEIRDEAGRLAAPGEVGEIVVTVPDWTAVDGYFRPDAALAARFTAGVLRTGDRGSFDADGFLCLEGRNEELLKVAGHRVATPGVEERLRALLATEEVCVVGVPAPLTGEVPVAVYVPTAATPAPAALLRLGRERLDRYEAPRWYLARRALPRTGVGKVRRAALEEEARRWVSRWPTTVAAADRLWPAAGAGAAPGAAPDHVCLDGVPPDWRRDLALPPLGPLDRELCFATREAPRELVAWAALADAAGPLGHALRVLRGPLPATALAGDERLLRALLAQLCELAAALPGPPPAAVAARPEPVLSAAFAAAGWVPAPGHPGVLLYRLDPTAPLDTLWPPAP